MTPEQWHKVKEVFEAALERAPWERSAFLEEVCSGDKTLHSEVKGLLSSYEEHPSFMETAAAEIASSWFVKEEGAALVGRMIGHYRLVREIGRGGMGVVYLAQDLSLDRPVALKLLPAHLTSDPDRVRRLEREARTASALNHPNVCVIHEIGRTDDDGHFIAMEYIDGITLRQHLTTKRMKLSEALDVSVQVATALGAAQKVGIVHRDIKPENIMLRADGYVKILDFGLAKLTEAQAIHAEPNQSPSARNTGPVGTANYMSPEQARGLSVDARTDIFSLGVVLYEMVTGEVPFKGETPNQVVGALLEQDPEPLKSHWSMAPSGLQETVNKALAKQRDKRYQTFADFLIDLKQLTQGSNSETKVSSPAPNGLVTGIIGKRPFVVSPGILLATALIVVTLVGVWLYGRGYPRERALAPMKVTPFTSLLGFESNPAFSPDGNFIAFCWGGEKDDNVDVYVQEIGKSGPPRRLTHDPAADILPVWSPDGTQIAFSRVKSETDKAAFVIPAQGGPERKVYTSKVKSIWGGEKNLDWSPDGKFLVAPDKVVENGPYQISLISLDTLESRQLTFAPENTFGDLNPQFSPDGKSVSFSRLMGGGTATSDIYIVPVGGGEPRRLTSDSKQIKNSTWTADGREIVFSSNRGGSMSLWRIPASGGTPEQLPVGELNASTPSISRQGNLLAYVRNTTDTNMYRLSLDRAARASPTMIASSTQTDGMPGFSPDGQQIAFVSDRSGNNEIWLCDSDGSKLRQLTTLESGAGSPRWSPDGQQIVFDSREKGSATQDVYLIGTQGGAPRRLTTLDNYEDHAPSWSNDGKWIYFSSNRSGDYQVWKVPLIGGDPVQVTTQGGFKPFESADGKFIYYAKGVTAPGIWRVPISGGEEVLVLDAVAGYWGNWGLTREGIYYIDAETKIGAAIEFFNFGTRHTSKVASLGRANVAWLGFAVSPDGKSALYTLMEHEGSDIMLVENFH